MNYKFINDKVIKTINFDKHEEVEVSVLVPICNVEKYLCRCINSLINQSMTNIEIICINDGSTDKSGEILDSYALKDNRIKVIHKINSGYGDSMNIGLQCARGKYIGILESDDFAELDMFERLYSVAKIQNADIVKSNFYLYWEKGENNKNIEKNELFKIIETEEDRLVINPVKYKDGKLFKAKASIWSALYKTEFLKDNNINFLDTPGASFQDTAFTFKVFSSTERMVLVEDAYVHYRQDNESSSINNLDKKIPFIFKEYSEIFKYIGIDRFCDIKVDSEERKQFDIAVAAFYDACIWMYEGLSIANRYKFLCEVSQKLKTLLDAIPIKEIAFGGDFWKYRDIKRIAKTPFEYHIWRECERYKQQGKILLPSKKEKSNFIIKNPELSIIIPAYNSEAYITACLESIRNQNYKNYEVICIDDGSTDDTLKILKYYSEIDGRFRYLSIKNSGPSAARNKGIDMAIGKYIVFMDSDDYYSENALKILSDFINKTNQKVDTNYVFSANIYPNNMSNQWLEEHLQCENRIFENLNFKTYSENKYLGIYIWKWAFNTNFLQKNHIRFDEDLVYGEDAVFIFKVLGKTKRIASTDKKIYNYRVENEESLMHGIEHTKKYPKTQMVILGRILDVLYASGEKPSNRIFEFCADFVYGALNINHDVEAIQSFIDIIKNYSLLEYVENSSENAKGFYKWCESFILENSNLVSGQHLISEKANKTTELSGTKNNKNIIKNIIKKIFPISRQAYYDYESKKFMLIEEQTQEIINLRNEIKELKENIHI